MKETTKLILNRIFAILTGVVAGAIVMGMLEMISNSMYPFPTGADLSDPAVIKEHISTLPISAFLIVLTAHAIGALTGGFVASKMAKVEKRGAALYTGLILLLAGVLNLISIPHPLWFSIVDVILFTPMALLGNMLRSKIWP
ncbi:hypothetical protein [Portibacter marinus]|uniref:hypothetical protein n=1 Tax=Portibacter marinus TaxID=2898660 RepID=UPI001F47A23F|nr:hypothetical protein [Portibacter marinus]